MKMCDADDLSITIERTGGFTGIPVRRSISSGSLGPQQREQLHQLLEECGVFARAPNNESISPDRFAYRFIVETPCGKKSVAANEGQLSQSDRALIDFVFDNARQ
jgi:hypothetical protein